MSDPHGHWGICGGSLACAALRLAVQDAPYRPACQPVDRARGRAAAGWLGVFGGWRGRAPPGARPFGSRSLARGAAWALEPGENALAEWGRLLNWCAEGRWQARPAIRGATASAAAASGLPVAARSPLPPRPTAQSQPCGSPARPAQHAPLSIAQPCSLHPPLPRRLLTRHTVDSAAPQLRTGRASLLGASDP